MPRSMESPVSLQEHIEATYLGLRVGIAVIGAALPFVLWFGGLGLGGVPLQGSMSAYYYTEMRNVFVGALCAIGVALYLYKGFSRAEHLALTLAGALSVCVALFPTRSGDAWEFANYVHVVAAVGFFLCIAHVSLFRASDTLSLIRDTDRARRLERLYRILGAMMVTSPAVALLVAWLLRGSADGTPWVFFVEAFGVWAFAAYWLVKSRELRQTSADRAAAQGALVFSASAGLPSAPGRLLQVAPLDESLDEAWRMLEAESTGHRGLPAGE